MNITAKVSAYVNLHLQPDCEPILSDTEVTSVIQFASSAAEAVADGWELKAAKVAGDYTFKDQTVQFNRSEVFAQCSAQATKWRKKCVGSTRVASEAVDNVSTFGTE